MDSCEKVLQDVLGHRANGRIGTAERRRRPRGRALDELADGLIAKMPTGVRFRDRGEHALTRMPPRQGEDALNETNGAQRANANE